MDQNQMFQNQDAPAQIPTGDSDIPIKMSPDTFQHQNKHRDACQSMSIFPQDAMTWEDDPRTRSQSPLGNEASMASFDEADPSFNVGNGLRRMDNNSNNNPSHFINEWHMARPPPSVGFAPLQAEHPSACTQHFHAQGDVPMGGPPCTCMSSYPPSQVPPAVPTPPPSDGSGPLSPHMTGDWLPFTASGVDPNLPKQIRLSQCVSSNSPILRPDGVRKKNAKFEIPEDRNLDTLDALIKHAKNDAELKELKMQKRLLRNREAALHSRQKKKSHTEQLEKDNASLGSRMYHMQEELAALRIRVEAQSRDQEDARYRQAQAEQRARALQLEREQLVESHAKESLKLREEAAQLRQAMQTQHRQLLLANQQRRQQHEQQQQQQQRQQSLRPSSSTSASSARTCTPLSSLSSGNNNNNNNNNNGHHVIDFHGSGGNNNNNFAGDFGSASTSIDSDHWERSFDFVNDFCLEPGSTTLHQKRTDSPAGAGPVEMMVQ